MWRKKQDGSKFGTFAVIVLNALFCCEENHCMNSYTDVIERRRVAAALRNGSIKS
jgi:hypothetical protein